MKTTAKEALPLPQHRVDHADRPMNNLASFDLTFTDYRKVCLKSQKALRCRINVQQEAYFPEAELIPCHVHVRPLESQVTVEIEMNDTSTENIEHLVSSCLENLFDELMSLNEPTNKNFERFSELLRYSGFTTATSHELQEWVRLKDDAQINMLEHLGGITAEWKMDAGEYLEAQFDNGYPSGIHRIGDGDFTGFHNPGPISTMVLLKRIEC